MPSHTGASYRRVSEHKNAAPVSYPRSRGEIHALSPCGELRDGWGFCALIVPSGAEIVQRKGQIRENYDEKRTMPVDHVSA